MSAGTTWLLALLAGVSLLLVLACTQPADATGEGEASANESVTVNRDHSDNHSASPSPAAPESGYCAQDASRDHVIDTADIAAFTGAFGQTSPLDFAPVPLGNTVVDTAELAQVTAIFGQSCLGMFSGSAAFAAMTMAIPPPDNEIWGCGYNLSFPGYAVVDGSAWLSSWGGGVGCFHGSGGFLIQCTLQVLSLVDGTWQLRASTPPLGWFGGTECVGSGLVASSLPCGKLAAGHYSHEIRRGDGSPVHNQETHFMLSDMSEAFTPC